MTQHIEAVFSGGVLKPDRELGLRERQRVRLIVETVDEVPDDRQAALARLREQLPPHLLGPVHLLLAGATPV